MEIKQSRRAKRQETTKESGEKEVAERLASLSVSSLWPFGKINDMN